MKLRLQLLILCLSFSILIQAKDTTQIENGTRFFIENKSSHMHSPKFGDIITMKLIKYDGNGTLLFSTDEIHGSQGIEIRLNNPNFPGDILHVFTHLKPGERATVTVPKWVADQDSALMGQESYYRYQIELVNYITEKELQKRQDKLLKSLREIQGNLFDSITNSLSSVYQVTYKKDGLYILKSSKQKVKKKEQIKSGQKIRVHYILHRLPEMHELDNSYQRSESFEFIADQGQVIRGWDIAIRQLKPGDQAILLIPSWLAYGFSGSGFNIKPNTPLYFEIEILK